MVVPVEPPESPWQLPSTADLVAVGTGEHGVGDLVAIGADLEPGTVLAAYRAGMFPMPVDDEDLGWWSPHPRGVLPLVGLTVSRSLRRSCARYEVRLDTAFADVIDACADPSRPHGWISPQVRTAYVRLHELGWAHSVETWSGGRLVGGLYGLAIGGLFAGESMFHAEPDASKVALVALVDLLRADGDARRLLDVQWSTEHLASLGTVELSREEYLARLEVALEAPLPAAFG